MNTFADYVLEHTTRGSCTCGKCADAPAVPNQPNGHTVSVEFFEIANNGGTREEFLELVKRDHPVLLNGEQHDYIAIGGMVGSQEIALMAVGLGALLGVWHLLSPTAIFGERMPKEIRMAYAERGFVGAIYRPAFPAIGAELSVDGLADSISTAVPTITPPQREANRTFMHTVYDMLKIGGMWGWPNTGTTWEKTERGFRRTS